MTIELDGGQMTDRERAHDHLGQQFALPEYYGRNLDALYDLLTERKEPTDIVLRNRGALEEHLGAYAHALLQTLRDAARDNPRVRWMED